MFLRKIFTITVMIFCLKSHAQKKIVVDKDIINLSSLIDHSTYISDLKKVPEKIKFNLENYLSIILDKLYVNAQFRDGYISDLAGYFKENPNTFDRGWIITKYQFVYNLKVPELGIVNYPLKIDMDEYGQIINCNWPRKRFGKPNDFVSRVEIEKRVLKWAEKKKLDSNDYDVDLIYDSGNNTMSWKIQFPAKEPGVSRRYQILEINWINGEILKEYNIYTSISN
ncbi:hypothetical protein J0X14_15190 [Muricauda sp. CAU 1633]|uniref:hypothetical protein n=1 Tax=Allomuricauda sp. CAU 1633 TaxID=2816036 RepID=UPI001A8D69E8|nr:hypothetical protein [Muricauda sp. CAU 1633]MBO0323653.1 hypothetical protein [Muricauda sp. CAU 1633]